VAIVTLILLEMDGGGGKAKLPGWKALLIGWSQGQYGTSHAAWPFMLTRE
jgi:hypothetical protein